MANLFSKAAKPVDENAEGAEKKKPKKPAFTLKPTKQTCILLGALSGTLLAASAGLFIWQRSEISELESQVTKKQEEVANARKITNKLKDVEAEYAAMLGQLRYLETSVSGKEYVPTLLKQMEKLVKQVNLTVQSTRPTVELAEEPPTDKEARKKWLQTHEIWPYDKVHVEMELAGSYWDIARLLYRLNSFEKIVAVENIQLAPVTDAGEYSRRLSVRLRLTGFIFREDDKKEEAKPPEKTAQLKQTQLLTETRA